MGEMTRMPANSVELFPAPIHANVVADELGRLLDMIKTACPEATAISFDFDGKLHIRVDVRHREDVAVIEKVLQSLGGGRMFYSLSLGATPLHPFHHRISALVDS